jgi:tetratricopeptide (TPR) repeat protein
VAKYSDDDVGRIAAMMRRSRDNEKPFHIITGAGCSVSAGIPLAQTLVAEILEKYGAECQRRLTAERLNNYGACMSCLSKEERRDLLKPYLDNAKINWAHIALAAMTDAGFVDRVLTFNFDSILAKACGLYGLYPATYDFAAAPSRETNYIATPAILHLHGQGFARVMLNTVEETTSHANELKPLITNTLESAPLLVIGYSGQADAVFPILSDAYSAQQRLYWAGYEEEPRANVKSLIQKGGNTAEYLGGADADRFMIDLAKKLGCWPPKMFKDPFKQLLSQLAPVADFPLPVGSGEDLLTKLKNELQTASVARAENKTPDLNLLMMEEKWNDVIKFADEDKTEEAHLKVSAYIMQGNALSDVAQLKQDLALFELSFAKYARAVEIKPDSHEAYMNWGNTLSGLARLKQDEGLFREGFAKYARAVEIKPHNDRAFYNWGTALSYLALLKQDERLFRESFEQFACAVKIKPGKSEALINWGVALSDLAQLKQDEGLFRESLSKYARAVEIKPDSHEAYMNWGNTLSVLARLKQDEGLFRESFSKYARAVEIKPDSHEAYMNWGNTLSGQARLKQDEGLFREGFAKYARAVEIKSEKHEAFMNWGNALWELAQLKQDESLFRESFARYARAIDIKPDEFGAYTNLAAALLTLAQLKNDEAFFDQANEKLRLAEAINPELFYSQASLYARENNIILCRMYFEVCKAAGRLPSRRELMTDNALENIRNQFWFQGLIADLPE